MISTCFIALNNNNNNPITEWRQIWTFVIIKYKDDERWIPDSVLEECCSSCSRKNYSSDNLNCNQISVNKVSFLDEAISWKEKNMMKKTSETYLALFQERLGREWYFRFQFFKNLMREVECEINLLYSRKIHD